MIKWYDTSALLENAHLDNNDTFYISSITLAELEHIKTSATKDFDIKAKARRIVRWLLENDSRYSVSVYNPEMKNVLFEDNNDGKILNSIYNHRNFGTILFITCDICCYHLAKNAGIKTTFYYPKKDDYTGFIEVNCSEKELTNFYNNFSESDNNPFDLLLNQYLIINDENGNFLDAYKYTIDGHQKLRYPVFESSAFGKIKPRDIYQQCAMDSLIRNKMTVLRGSAGTGKSWLALGYLFSKLEKGVIDKIIIFCNTVAVTGAAKLGFYPGSMLEKLLDSQIGNFLGSKLGDKSAVQALIDEGKLILLPFADIRGYDTTGMNAGVYITEAQNLDIELMRLALQRVGEDCIVILDGDDLAQVDMQQYAGNNNGLKRVSEIFRNEDFYGEVTLQNIHRSKIAQLAQLM